MEQASPIVPDATIVRRCNNINRKRKEKLSFVPEKSGHNPLEDTDSHNSLKKMKTLDMEQASPIVSLRRCNNNNRRGKEKLSFLPVNSAHNSLENTDIHNPLKKMEILGGFSIYHHHHIKQKNNPTTPRVVSSTKNKIVGGDDELPVDSIYNILSRMPLKSLARFQCVSKVWCKYINDPYLEIVYNAKRGAMKDDHTMLFMFQLMQHDGALLTSKNASASLSMLLVTKEEEEEESHQVVITKKNPAYTEFCSIDWGIEFNLVDIILGSCNGLIISSQGNNNVDDGTIVLLVINPLKKQCYKLPPIKIWSCRSLYYHREACGLGFDDSTNTYKMVCVVLRNQMTIRSYYDDNDVVKEDLCTMVHVLGTDSSWREIHAVPPYPISGEGVFANGCLHWLVSCRLKYWPLRVVRKVIYFDVTKEEFGLIDSPPNNSFFGICVHLVDLDGQVGIVYQEQLPLCSVEVWLLNHKTKCWAIHCRFGLKPHVDLDDMDILKVIGYWNKDAGDLLVTDFFRKRLFIYRLKRGVLHEADFIYEDHDIQNDIRLYQPTFSSILRSLPFNHPN